MEELIEHVQTDEFINQQIEQANHFLEKYTDNEFLDAILNADALSEKRQREFNQTLLYDASLELGSLYLPIGIYNADLQNASHLGFSWSLEWWFYTMFTKQLTQVYVQHLLASKADTSYFLCNTPLLNKKIISIVFAYALISVISKQISTQYLLHEKLEQMSLPPASSYFPASTKASLLTQYSPQAWENVVTDFFQKLGWMPVWTEYFSYQLTKEFTTLLTWLCWYERSIARPLFQARLDKSNDVLKNMIDALDHVTKAQKLSEQDLATVTDTQRALHRFVLESIHKPFAQWLVTKTTQLTIFRSISSMIIATPAWYQAGKLAYQMYHTVKESA